MNPLSRFYWIGKGVGWDNVPRRLVQSFRIRSGALKAKMAPARFEPKRCEIESIGPDTRIEQWKNRSARLFVPPNSRQLQQLVARDHWQELVVEPLEDALRGNYPMFSRWTAPLGWPPNFNKDASNNIEWPVGDSWLRTAKSGPPRDDIKLVWEPSRLTIIYLLARAYQYDRDVRWAQAFWELVEAWIEQNPVNESVAWGCGQEVALRLMAILFGTNVVLHSPETTPDRLRKIDILAWQSGCRIEPNINYAISQENNHALSEAVGLFTLGLLYPELTDAKRWLKIGKSILEKEIQRQIYSDGSYVQHSMSYHRVMLDDMLWAIVLGEMNDESLSDRCLERVKRSVVWLDQYVDPENGRVPNLGANDGANVLPLSCSDYLDYRPVLDSLSSVLQIPIADRGTGVWKEKALWFAGSPSEFIRPQTTSNAESKWSAPEGGYHLLRNKNGYLLLRAGNYSDRPGQCDMLHVDLWFNHLNILRDSGSFHYYHRDPKLKNYFYSVAAHNTLGVEGRDQMTKGPNFLWFHWPEVMVRFTSDNSLFAKARFGGAGSYAHSGSLTFTDESLLVRDEIGYASSSVQKPNCTLRWHLAPEVAWEHGENNTILGRVDETPFIRISVTSEQEGHLQISERPESLYYGEMQLVPTLEYQSADLIYETKIEFLS